MTWPSQLSAAAIPDTTPMSFVGGASFSVLNVGNSAPKSESGDENSEFRSESSVLSIVCRAMVYDG